MYDDMERVLNDIPSGVEKAFIRMHKRMDAQTYVRSTETVIFDQGVRKYVRFTAAMIFDKVYVTDHNFITTDRIGLLY